MTADRDADLPLDSWFADHRAADVPEDLLERSLERVASTRQRPRWLVRDGGWQRRAVRGAPATRERVGWLFATVAAVLVLAIGVGVIIQRAPQQVAQPSIQPSIAPLASPPAVAPASPVHAAALGSGRLIAFVRSTDVPDRSADDPSGPPCGGRHGSTCAIPRLWLVGADGSDAHPLQPDGVDGQGEPTWSPDGAWLVYTEGTALWLADVRGGAAEGVDTGCAAPCAFDASAAFSTDGTRLAFVRYLRDGRTVIATMDLASGRVAELQSTLGRDAGRPSWSPDGRSIAFTRATGKPAIGAAFIVGADGQGLRQISPSTVTVVSAAWSPDGARILLTSLEESSDTAVAPRVDLATIRPDGTDLRALTTDGSSGQASWIPDGRIVFVRGVAGASSELWTMAADGAGAARLALGDGSVGSPVWQPVGGAVVAPPWVARGSAQVGPPPPTPEPTPTPSLGPGFSWTGRMADLSSGPLGDTATLLADGRVLMTGGCTLAAALYDPASETFTPTGSLGAIRAGKTATRLRDGRVLVTGGYDCGPAGQDSIQSSAELYDPVSGTFSPTGPMGTPRSRHTATLLDDGRVLVVGGQTMSSGPASGAITLASYRTADTSANVLATAEVYDPATGTFAPTGRMDSPRDSFTATLLLDGRVLVVGGGGEGYASRRSAELYDPATGRFSRTGPMAKGRWLHSAARLADGRVLIAGGRSPNDATYKSAELFDPATGTFQTTGSMATSRQAHAATTLPDGRVLVVGGFSQKDSVTAGHALASAELYDPSTGTFTAIGSIGDRRDSPTATLLADGSVLIAGGIDIGDDGAVAATSAVRYRP